MPTVYFLVGIQGSGKTTWARANAERLEAIILASDDVRNELEAQGMNATGKGALVFAVWLDVPLDVCLARNRQKPGGLWGDRVVPKETLLGVARGFEKPTLAEFNEIWKGSEDGRRIN